MHYRFKFKYFTAKVMVSIGYQSFLIRIMFDNMEFAKSFIGDFFIKDIRIVKSQKSYFKELTKLCHSTLNGFLRKMKPQLEKIRLDIIKQYFFKYGG